jgi:hypothetical protein
VMVLVRVMRVRFTFVSDHCARPWRPKPHRWGTMAIPARGKKIHKACELSQVVLFTFVNFRTHTHPKASRRLLLGLNRECGTLLWIWLRRYQVLLC